MLFGDFRQTFGDPSHLRLSWSTRRWERFSTRRARWPPPTIRSQLEPSRKAEHVGRVRAVLRLRGEVPPRQLQLSNQSASRLPSSRAFAQVIWHKRGESAIKLPDVSRVLAGYLAGMQLLVRYLDQFSGRKT